MERATISPTGREAEPATIQVPASVRFPVELDVPPGFDPGDPVTWPRIEGRVEYVDGRLLYMPPCGDLQQGVAVGVTVVLGTWGESHPEFFVGGNEAGMRLGQDTRGAEGAVWRRDQLGPFTGRYVRVPPILAAEVAGTGEGEPELRDKARWYLSRGVQVVWIALPRTREVIVLHPDGESRHGVGERLPPHPALPELEPEVARFFRQLDQEDPSGRR
jgi:Uma2 family endonuclease